MKLISEEEITAVIENEHPDIFYIPDGRILSPAARDVLNQNLIPIDVEKNRTENEKRAAREDTLTGFVGKERVEARRNRERRRKHEAKGNAVISQQIPVVTEKEKVQRLSGAGTEQSAGEYFGGLKKDGAADPKSHPKGLSSSADPGEQVEKGSTSRRQYRDHETGAIYSSKPEYMTSIYGNELVMKDHPVIQYRGKLDSIQAQIVFAQCLIRERDGNEAVIRELDDILDTLREMMRCEVLREAFTKKLVIGLDHDELRAQSHDPEKYFNIKRMRLPDVSLGLEYSLLNGIRTSIREGELLAVKAFRSGENKRTDLLEEWNRLSSALHIMMCRQIVRRSNGSDQRTKRTGAGNE